MSEHDRFEYPKLDNEVITVTGFLNLKSATIKMGKITVLIGEQASGKSILAKFQYFFWNYQSDLFNAKSLSKESMTLYNEDKVDELFKLFSLTNKNPAPFKIEYRSGDIKITLERVMAGDKPIITTSDFLKELYEEKKLDYNKYKEDVEKAQTEEEMPSIEFRRRSYWMSSKERRKFRESIPTVLYVPAIRSFFSTIKENVFALLAEEAESLDPLMIEFGYFFEYAKRINQRSSIYGGKKIGLRRVRIIKDILKGDFIQENDEDIIRTDWGDVELRHASSGQQESLPLILSLLYFPSSFMQKDNQLIIIEEPEAHLFPTAQKRILEEIVKVTQDRSCSVLIATHSPYIPTCLNNEIQFAINKEKPLDVKAYCVSKGKAKNIYLKKEYMIDTDQIDSVSEEIMSEYYHALKEYDEHTEDKDKSNE